MIIHVDIPSLKALKIVISSLLCQAFEKAALGGSLDKVIAVAQKAIDNTRSIGGETNFLYDSCRRETELFHTTYYRTLKSMFTGPM